MDTADDTWYKCGVKLVCLDLEGVLVPEIWISVAEKTGIDDLRLTTRDITDYDELMRRRIEILTRHQIGLDDILSVIATISPLPGASRFLDTLRASRQVVILSDTFVQFADSLMDQLGRPTLFCNELVVDSTGMIRRYKLRQQDGKKRAVDAFRSIGLEVTAVGDSYNDLSMIMAADHGALFRAPDRIATEFPDLPRFVEYDELLAFLLNHAKSHA